MTMKDFFVSYNSKDKQWAEWIAWELEAAGYTTVIQAWDFRPGGNFVLDMQEAAAGAERTIAVLSQNYLDAQYTQSEWAAAFAQDSTGAKKTLLPVRIQECDLKGLLSQIVYIDLVGKSPEEAKDLLMQGLRRERVKPSQAPGFPGSSASVPAQAGGGPVTPPPFPPQAEWGQQNITTQQTTTTTQQNQIGGVNFSDISGGSINVGNIDAGVKAGGHIVGGNLRVTGDTANDPDSPEAKLIEALETWRQQIETTIAQDTTLDADDKEYIQKTAAKFEEEMQQGQQADTGKAEAFLVKMSKMAPDILEVTAATLQNPFRGVGLVLEKINNRIKVEKQERS